MIAPETPHVGDTWDFGWPDLVAEGVAVDGSSIIIDGVTTAVAITCRVYVNGSLLLTPTPLYDRDRRAWVVQFALPRAGSLMLIWKADVGGLIRKIVQTMKVEQTR